MGKVLSFMLFFCLMCNLLAKSVICNGPLKNTETYRGSIRLNAYEKGSFAIETAFSSSKCEVDYHLLRLRR